MADDGVGAVRRVVTGRNDDGGEVFVEDGPVDVVSTRLLAGIDNHPLWSTAGVPASPNDGTVPGCETFYPGPGGVRFFLLTLAPASSDAPEPPTAADVDEAERLFPGLIPVMTVHELPGMHATATIDLGVVLAGEIVLELETGEERTLRAGDTFVQNGTWHRWHNRGSQPARMAVVFIGAVDGRATDERSNDVPMAALTGSADA